MVRTPSFCTIQQVKELPAGSFVKPVHFDYVPKETKEKLGIDRYFDPSSQTVCYTALGFMVISKDNLRET